MCRKRITWSGYLKKGEGPKGGSRAEKLWVTLNPLRLNFYIWETWHEKMMTLDNLKKTGNIIGE